MNALRRLPAALAVVGAVILLGLTFAGSATAADPAPYPSTSSSSSGSAGPGAGGGVSSTSFTPGSSGSVSGSGATPNGAVHGELLSKAYDLGSSTANASGDWTLNFTIPSDVPAGQHHIVVTDGATGRTLLDAAVSISGSGAATPSGGGSGSTAFTGVAVAGIGGLGALLAVGGVVLLFAGRRRRVHS